MSSGRRSDGFVTVSISVAGGCALASAMASCAARRGDVDRSQPPDKSRSGGGSFGKDVGRSSAPRCL